MMLKTVDRPKSNPIKKFNTRILDKKNSIIIATNIEIKPTEIKVKYACSVIFPNFFNSNISSPCNIS